MLGDVSQSSSSKEDQKFSSSEKESQEPEDSRGMSSQPGQDDDGLLHLLDYDHELGESEEEVMRAEEERILSELEWTTAGGLITKATEIGGEAAGTTIKLVALDMDGTLLNSDVLVPEENQRALVECERTGAAARSLTALRVTRTPPTSAAPPTATAAARASTAAATPASTTDQTPQVTLAPTHTMLDNTRVTCQVAARGPCP